MRDIGPIFRALVHNKARFWLIALEVALTLAVVANCVNMMLDLRADYLRPSGYDEPNLLVVATEPFAPEFREKEFINVTRERDLERLRAHPGVRSAAAVSAIPMSGGGSASGRRPVGTEMHGLTSPYFRVSDGVVDTFGLELVAGRDFVPGDFDLETDDNGDIRHRNSIVSQALADALFPDGDALGKEIEDDQGETGETIVGIVAHMHNSWPQGWEKADWAMLWPDPVGDYRRMRYMVRTEPGALEGIYSELEEVMLALNPGRIVKVESLTEHKLDHYSDSLALIKVLTAVIFLLVLVTSLGIVGLTSFSVTQRTRQIGTRRALGATKLDIVGYFLIENWMITGFGLVLGVGMAFGLNYALAQFAGAPKMDWTLLAGGALLLWTTGVAAALAPALRAMRVAPEVATRTI